MSRTFFRKPEFRLLLGYPSLTLFREASGPVATADIAAPDPGAALAGLAAEVARTRGRLTAVLPEAEVWRALLALPARSPLERRRIARRAAAAGLAAAPDAIALVLGPRDAAGRTPIAAVRRDVLAETRSFLTRAGLRPAAVTGAGDFAGFAAPPRLWSHGWHAPAGLRIVVRPAPVAALSAAALAVILALALRPGAPELAAPVPALPAATETALATAVPSKAGLRPLPRPAGFHPPAAVEPEPDVRTALPAQGLPPRSDAAPLVTMASRNVAMLPSLPKPKSVPAMRLSELTTARVRLADTTPVLALRRAAPAAAAAVTAALAPLRRPDAAPAPEAKPAAGAAAPAEPPKAVAKPTEPARPPVATAEPAAATPEVVGQRPLPRPDSPAPAPAAKAEAAIQVASLAPGPEMAALVASALAASEPRVVAPLARPERAAPAPVAAPAPAAAQPVQRQTTSQPAQTTPAELVKREAATTQPVKRQAVAQPSPAQLVKLQAAAQASQAQPVKVAAQPAPAQTVKRKVVAQPAPPKQPAMQLQANLQPARVQAAAPAKKAVQRQASPQPVRAKAAAPQRAKQKRTATAKPARSGIVLVGIFGSTNGRHALVQLPNGSIERVRAGDRVQGVQVAEVGADTVRLRGSGRDAVLRLPN